VEDVADLKQHVQSLRHHIHGNGGLGLLRRVDVAEQEIDHFRGNFVEKGECRRNRVEDFNNVEREFKAVRDALAEMKDTRSSDKRMTITVIGVLSTSLFSAASLVVSILSQIGGK